MQAVVDTNVVVSGVLSRNGPPAGILDLWRQERFELVVSPPLLAEYRRALGYDRVRKIHRLSDEELDVLVTRFGRFATVVEPAVRLNVIRDDPDDNRVLECAHAAATEFIVSGDKHLLALGRFRGIRIVRPADFVAFLDGVEPLNDVGGA